MTTMSMNAGYLTDRRPYRVRALLPTQRLSAISQEISPALEWCHEHLLDRTGGLTLAMLPFSLLAWLFIAH